nr:hypothetical protein [Natranaerofaba carboxydovora]
MHPDDFFEVLSSFKRKGATIICLDKERDYYRGIYFLDKSNKFQFDLSKIESNSLINDLSNRDFTINAVALPTKFFLKNKVKDEDFIDPYKGISDIKDRILRPVCNKSIFEDDPVRIIRGFRFISRGFSPVDSLYGLMEKHKDKLKNVSPERIYQELFVILENGIADNEAKSETNSGDIYKFLILNKMTKLGIWSIIFPFNNLNLSDQGQRISEDYLLKVENQLSGLIDVLKNELIKEEDITFLKWLIWWNALYIDKEKTEFSRFINDYNSYFPVLKKHKKYTEFYLRGSSDKDLLYQTAKSYLEKTPETKEEEIFFIVGQIFGKLSFDKLSYKGKQYFNSEDFYRRKKMCENLNEKLKLIRKEIDGKFILSYLDKKPGPWLKEFIKEVHLDLLIKLTKAPPDKNDKSEKDIKKLGQKAISKLKECEGIGGE